MNANDFNRLAQKGNAVDARGVPNPEPESENPRGRLSVRRRKAKAERKANRKPAQVGLVKFAASGRVYAVTGGGYVLRLDGKRGRKNRAKGWIE